MGEGGEEGLHDIFWWKSNESKYHLYYDGIWNFLRNKKKLFHGLKKNKTVPKKLQNYLTKTDISSLELLLSKLRCQFSLKNNLILIRKIYSQHLNFLFFVKFINF